MKTAPSIRNVLRLAKECVLDQYQLMLPLLAIFSLPFLLRPIISGIVLSRYSLVSSFAYVVLSIILSVFYPLGSLSISLCTYAWLKKKKSNLRAVIRSLNSVAGYAVSTYIGQALIVAVPIGISMILLSVFHVAAPTMGIILTVSSNAIYSLLFFFSWPLLIIKRLYGMRNVTKCLSFCKNNLCLIFSFVSGPIFLQLVLELLTMKSIPLIREILVGISYIVFFPLATAAMCAFKVIYYEDFDIPL